MIPETLIDLPWGDYFWMKEVNLKDVTYVGGDIVTELIEKNRDKYGTLSRISFREIDLLTDDLPSATLMMNRDCLVHLSFVDM